MTDAPKHTGRITYKYEGEKGPAAVDIDDEKAAPLAEMFLPHTSSMVVRRRASTPSDGFKIASLEAYLDALEEAERVDHGWFALDPRLSGYVRDLIPNEFGVENAPPRLPQGKRWMTDTTAFRHPEDGRVILRLRQAVVRPFNPAQNGGVR